MSENYDDILYLPHHISQKRRQMTMIDRAAQFSPFAALTGFDAAIQETGRLTDGFIDLDADSIAMLDHKLRRIAQQLDKHPEITVTYFIPDERKSGGKYGNVTGRVKTIDLYEKAIRMEKGTIIPFERIYDICGEGDVGYKA